MTLNLRKGRLKVLILIILCVFTILQNYNYVINQDSNNASKEGNIERNTYDKLMLQTTYWTETHIFINDSDPAANWNITMLTNEWCTGSGISGDPYMIDTVLLLRGSSETNIEIVNSRVYFQINNCLFLDCDKGINLNNVSNGIISNNVIIDMGSNFIEINNCTNISIENNQITDICMEGIIVAHSTNISIIENKIDTFCGMNHGISLSYVNYSYIINNTVSFTGGYVKIEVYRSHNNLIMNNSLISTGGSGVLLYNSPYNNITHNTIKDCSDGIELYTNSMFNQISSNHIAVRYDAIDIWDSNLNLIFNNSIDDSMTFDNDQGKRGVSLIRSNNNTIVSNHIANLVGAIALYGSNFSKIINNTLFHNGYCISEYDSVGNVFENNSCIPIPSNQLQINGYLVFLVIIISCLGILFCLKKTFKELSLN